MREKYSRYKQSIKKREVSGTSLADVKKGEKKPDELNYWLISGVTM